MSVVLRIQAIYQFDFRHFSYLYVFSPEKFFFSFFTFPVTVSVTVKSASSLYADATSAMPLKSNVKLFNTSLASSLIG